VRRIVAVITVVTAVVFATDVAVSAAPSTANLNREVSGRYSGRQTFDFGTGGCSFVHQIFDGSFQVDTRSGTFHLDVCVSTGSPSFPMTGTFTVTAPNGAVLSGPANGATDAQTPTASLDVTLTVEHATKNFKHARGTIELTGTWSNEVFGSGPTNGTLTGHLHR
jgi:hypothetical protein